MELGLGGVVLYRDVPSFQRVVLLGLYMPLGTIFHTTVHSYVWLNSQYIL